jgi:hypothetical protein
VALLANSAFGHSVIAIALLSALAVACAWIVVQGREWRS